MAHMEEHQSSIVYARGKSIRQSVNHMRPLLFRQHVGGCHRRATLVWRLCVSRLISAHEDGLYDLRHRCVHPIFDQ